MSDQYTFDDQQDQIAMKEAWERALERLATSVPETSMKKFLKPLKCGSVEENSVSLIAPGKFVYEWVKDKYLDRIQEALSDEAGRELHINLLVQDREKPSAGVKPISVIQTAQPQPANPRFVPKESYTFDNFVVGQSNRLAFAGAKAVAQAPGAKYNPLFIYGYSGLGKTHLMHAIANEIMQREPGYPVMYVTAQQFAEDFVQSLKNNRIDQFRRLLRGSRVLLIDDIQFIAGKDRTQEEIFHTFNYLYQSGRQVVLCSDRPPRDLLLMEERLRSRFESGLVADVQMPDTETRCAIILKRAERESLGIDHDTAMYLAESINGNVRILEGALTKVAAQASLEGAPLTIDLARGVVESYYESIAVAKPSFNQILNAVSKHYQIDITDIKGLSRKAPIAHARHVSVYMTREILGDSWKHIGALFGDRDHTSMMHAYKKIRSMMNRDKELNASLKMLMHDLWPGS
ncbi:MAG: chromosomal replication initiator protein DnaA [Armatimonadetes bacterium]|nr:chromosomal replication initiator protein DnaA [Armatimonadota bacterium]